VRSFVEIAMALILSSGKAAPVIGNLGDEMTAFVIALT